MEKGPFCYPKELQKHDQNDNSINLNLHDIRNYAWTATAICVIIAVALTVYLFYKHLRYFHRPSHQKHIVRILLMVPVYAIDSWLSFRLYWLSVYFDLFRDCYEAFVINEFYNLLIAYTGGYKRSKDLFAQKDSFKMITPLCCITVSPKRGLLRTCKRLTLQYVVLRPILSALALMLHSDGRYCPGELTFYNRGYIWITLVMLVSVTVSMYALVLFYVVAKNELVPYNPVPKFLSIKFIIAMAFWQSVMVAALIRLEVLQATSYWSTDNMSTGVQNFLICIEMLIVAIWHVSAFSYKEYAEAAPEPTSVLRSFVFCFNPVDIVKDIWKSYAFVCRFRSRKGHHSRFEDDRSDAEMTSPPNSVIMNNTKVSNNYDDDVYLTPTQQI